MAKGSAIKPNVKNLPGHSQLVMVNNTWYVYFAYTFSINGKRGQERDYIGKVDPATQQFIPNSYYKEEKPTFENRSPNRWKNPVMKARALQKELRNSKEALPTNLELEGDYRSKVGVTALAMKLLETDGMPIDLGQTVYSNDIKRTSDFLNLVIKTLLTLCPTYSEDSNSESYKFIGTGNLDKRIIYDCLRESGGDAEAPYKLAKARVKRLEPKDTIAVDATRFDSNYGEVPLSEVGKQGGGFGLQWSYSILISTVGGEALCYRIHAGKIPDISNIEDFVLYCKKIGITEESPKIVGERGSATERNIVKLVELGFSFLIGLKKSLPVVRKVIEQHYSDFYQINSVLPGDGVYGIESKVSFKDEVKSVEFSLFVFRDPKEQSQLTMEMVNKLDNFERGWEQGNYDLASPMAKYYVNPVKGQPLNRDLPKIENIRLTEGFFAFASNIQGLNIRKAFHIYRLRNEIESFFRQIYHSLTTEIHVESLIEIRGIMMVIFVVISILSILRKSMERPLLPRLDRNPGPAIKDVYSIAGILQQLDHIILEKRNGRSSLLNVTPEDLNIVESLGFKGLFSDAKQIDQLLSASHLAQMIKSK